jgi:heterodisulfide reductase subunit A-like polyferredoxin
MATETCSLCEDKCESVSPGVVNNDFEKGNELREKRLLYLKSTIPYNSNINHIEVLISFIA